MYEKLEKEIFAGGLENEFYSTDLFPRLAAFTLALGGLIVLFPLLLFCAFVVRCSSAGTILFRQARVGRGGRIFTLYKFRTMTVSVKGLPVTAENDSRITALGRILRKTKLDELPELYNVLRGDMAFVGPRPEVVELVNLNNPKWREVLKVRPGITDPVTLEFRNEEHLLAEVKDKQKFYSEVIQPYKLEGYLRYLETKSLRNDVKIVCRTLKVIAFPQTAPPINFDKIKDFQRYGQTD